MHLCSVIFCEFAIDNFITQIHYQCACDRCSACGSARTLVVLVLKSSCIHFWLCRLDLMCLSCIQEFKSLPNSKPPWSQFALWLWIAAKCVRYFYPESVISLDLSRCGLLAKAITCSWPGGAGGVGTQPWVQREGWRRRGRGTERCVAFVPALILLWKKERDMEEGSRRKRRRRRRSGTCEESSETESASPAKEKTGEGGRECMKTRGEEECETRRERKQIRRHESWTGEIDKET